MSYQVPDYKIREEIGRRMNEGLSARHLAQSLNITESGVNESEFKRDYSDDTAIVDLQRALNQAFATARHRVRQGYDAEQIKRALNAAVKSAADLYLNEEG